MSASLVAQMNPSCTWRSCVHHYCCLLNTRNTLLQKKVTERISHTYTDSAVIFKVSCLEFPICMHSNLSRLFDLQKTSACSTSEANQIKTKCPCATCLQAKLLFVSQYVYWLADKNKVKVHMI